MSKRDFYDILGVERSADDAALGLAYRKLAKAHHPDLNPGDAAAEQRFKEISEAYEILKDPERRAAYDRMGHAAFDGGPPGGASSSGHGGVDFGDFGAMGDIFEEFFGGGEARGSRRRAGADLQMELDVSLEEAFSGAERRMLVERAVACDTCRGSGSVRGSGPTPCKACNGRGKIGAWQGIVSFSRVCRECRGSGKIISDPCSDCRGRGQVRKSRTLHVAIPTGVDEGMRIRLRGEGDVGASGTSPGDLYVVVRMTPHPVFQRNGPDLYRVMTIPFAVAAGGGTIDVSLPADGKVKLTVPPGTQPGRKFRLRGKGMPRLRSRRFGDVYVEVNVDIPCVSDARRKRLLDAFVASLDEGGGRPRTGDRGGASGPSDG